MKKKILFSLSLCLMGMGGAKAADVLTVENVTVPQGSEAVIEVNCQFETEFKGYQFDLEFQEGLALVTDADGKPVCEKGFEGTDHAVSASTVSAGKYRFVCVSLTNMLLPKSGTLLKVRVTGAANLAIGTVLTGKISNVELTTKENNEVINLEDIPFTITIGEAPDTHFILDENSATAPAASEGTVDVRVKRTIKANEWSTIVLPFAMTEAQVKTAFGSDVALADFTGYDVEDDEDGNVLGITVNFTPVASIEANHPYIIKVSEPVTEFMVDGVDIEPEDEPTVATVKRTRKAWSELIGTYVANTEVPSKTLFLSGNKFYYSTGTTKMKAFRAYFDFYDVLTNVDESYDVKMAFNIDGEATGIDEMDNGQRTMDNVYDLGGRRVNKPAQRGIYIVDGKKVVIK